MNPKEATTKLAKSVSPMGCDKSITPEMNSKCRYPLTKILRIQQMVNQISMDQLLKNLLKVQQLPIHTIIIHVLLHEKMILITILFLKLIFNLITIVTYLSSSQ
jgi:hypothetical protein